MPSTNRRNLYILTFTLFVVMLGFGVVIPIIPFYMESFGAGGTELGLLVASYAVMRLIVGPVWGTLSDRVGRKPVLIIGVLGYAITMIWFGLATELWMLFAARILSGVLSSATSPTTMAYIGDSTSEEERGRGMGILGAAMGLGTIFGPFFGGLLAEFSLAVPFFIAGGMSFLALGLIILFLPESLPKKARRTPVEGQAGLDVRAWLALLRGPLGILFFMGFLMTYALTVFYGIFGLYALEKYGYGPDEVGTVFMIVGLISAITQGLLIGPITKCWGEALVIKVTLLAIAAGFFLMSLADQRWMVFTSIGFFILATSLLTPAVMAMQSKQADQEQGMVMGLSNAVMSLGRIIGPLWGGAALDIYLELPYLSSAVVLLAGFLMGLFLLTPKARDVKEAPLQPL